MDKQQQYYIDGPVTIEFQHYKPEPSSNPYYTVEPVMKRVTKEEFDAWLEAYPRHLEVDVCGICDPPSITYNDFELADRWPSSVVASTHAYDDKPGEYYYTPEEERYYSVMENFEDVFASRTRYSAKETNASPYVAPMDDDDDLGEVLFSFNNVQPCNFTEEGNSINDA